MDIEIIGGILTVQILKNISITTIDTKVKAAELI